MKQEPSTESIILGQKMVMISASYVTIFFYAIILWQLILLQELFTRTKELVIGFGVGALISILISTFIIRNALENQKNFPAR